MLNRITLTLEPEESQALRAMSQEDFRPAKEQFLYLLRLEAQRRGLLPKTFRDVMTNSENTQINNA